MECLGVCRKSTDRQYGNQVRSLVILGSMFVAIVCGTSNAFGSISGQIAEAEDFANWQTSLLSTAAFLGMYVTVFAGMAYDRVGPLWTVSVGASITVSGYVIVSICRGNEAGYGFMVNYLLFCCHVTHNVQAPSDPVLNRCLAIYWSVLGPVVLFLLQWAQG